MIIKIGKANDNDFVVNDPHVSRYHAKLVREEGGCWLLEDLGSTNGTFVNGAQIIKKHITPSDTIKLGDNYVLNIPEALKFNNDYSEEFAALKQVYDNYIQAKVKIQSSNQFKTRLFQSLPFALPGVVVFLEKEVRNCLGLACLSRSVPRQSVFIWVRNSRPRFRNCCKI